MFGNLEPLQQQLKQCIFISGDLEYELITAFK